MAATARANPTGTPALVALARNDAKLEEDTAVPRLTATANAVPVSSPVAALTIRSAR
jgi:hypothetical protein